MIAPIGVDSFVKENVPAANFGDTPRLWVNGGGSSDQRFSYLYHSRPFPFGARILSAKLRLYLNGAWSGTNSLTCKRVTSSWGENKLTWNNTPTVTATNSASASVVSGVDGQLVEFDITNMMTDVSSGVAWWGWRIEMSQHADRAFNSADNGTASLRPEFEVNWTLAPDAPNDLAPAAGDIVSSALPVLSWTMSFPGGGSETSAEVQVSTSTDFSAPEYDSGKQPNTNAIWDLYQNNLNLIPLTNQASFETNVTTGIVFIGSTTKTQDGTTFTQGTKSLKLVTPGSGPNEGFGLGSAAGATTNDAPAVAGTTYTFSLAMKGNAGGEQVNLAIFWRTAAGGAISTTTSSTITLTTGWVTYSVTGTAPGTTAFVELAARTAGTSAVTWFNDAAQFEVGSSVSPFSLPTGYVGAAPGATKWWRVKIWDDVDTASDWALPVSFTRTALGTLTLSSPGATTSDLTPPISWSLSGQTQESYRVSLFEVKASGKLVTLWYTAGSGSGTTSVTVPGNLIVTGKTYRARVEVWDTLNRANNEHQTVEQTFTYSRDGTVTAPSTMTAVAYNDGSRNTPVVVVTVTAATQPDYWSVKLNGVEYNSRIVASTTFVSGTTYRFYIWGLQPRVTTTVSVEAVRLSGGIFKNSTNLDATVRTDFVGIWLADDTLTSTLGQMVFIGDVQVDTTIGDSGTTYDIIGSREPVRLTDTIQGYRGTVTGQVLSKTDRDIFLALKDLSLNQDLRLVLGDLSIPVRLESVSASPRPEPGDYVFDVSFSFFQAGEPWPLAGV